VAPLARLFVYGVKIRGGGGGREREAAVATMGREMQDNMWRREGEEERRRVV
jgi:hypothetical protein